MSIANLLNPNDQSYLNLTVNNLSVLGTLTASNLNPTSSTDLLISTTMNFPGVSVPYVFRITTLVIGLVTHVTMHLPGNIQGASGAPAPITFNDPIPSNLKPIVSSQSTWPCIVDDNNTLVFGAVTISGGGNFNVTVGAGGNSFQAAGSCGYEDLFISWDLSNNQ